MGLWLLHLVVGSMLGVGFNGVPMMSTRFKSTLGEVKNHKSCCVVQFIVKCTSSTVISLALLPCSLRHLQLFAHLTAFATCAGGLRVTQDSSKDAFFSCAVPVANTCSFCVLEHAHRFSSLKDLCYIVHSFAKLLFGFLMSQNA